MKRFAALSLALALLTGCGEAPPEAAPPGETRAPAATLAPATEAPAPEPEESAPEPEETPPLSPPPEASAETPPERAADLAEELSALTETLDGDWSVYVKNLDSGETVALGEKPMVAASLIKLFVAGAYYDACGDDAPDQACESLVDVMLRQSDNAACNALIDLLGMDAINEFIAAGGYTGTVLNRKMLEASVLENYTTPADCGRALERIVGGTYVSAAVSEKLLRSLKHQERTYKIPAGVPYGVETANKTGELSYAENDAAVVWSDGGVYILCVMSGGFAYGEAARQSIVQISSMVYGAFNG